VGEGIEGKVIRVGLSSGLGGEKVLVGALAVVDGAAGGWDVDTGSWHAQRARSRARIEKRRMIFT
jgi:hypothetical protein